MLPLIVILGPTATGKTKIALALAQKFNGEIISGDSMQIYRQMDIGTAKIKPSAMKKIPHHLLDLKNPDEPFSVADFQKLAREKIKEIHEKNRLPFLVGGTGLYLDAVIYPYKFTSQKEISGHRHQLFSLAQEMGRGHLYQLLTEIDPLAAQKIHPHDLKRVIRALEYYYVTGGKRISDNKNAILKKPLYHLVSIGLTMERSLLYQRIEERVEQMMARGFLEEVKQLLDKGYQPDLPALQGLGYRQLIAHLQGDYDLTKAVTLIKQETRHYAKRQLTWFKKRKNIKWFTFANGTDNCHKILQEIMNHIGRTLYSSIE